MRGDASLPADYFERMFRDDPDPWKFETSPYEARKYDATLDALGTRTYDRALEIGCANGVLSARLAEHCRTLLAVDVSVSALSRARQRCCGVSNVLFENASFPGDQPRGMFDLIVLSEVVYYWSRNDIARAGKFIAHHLLPAGDVILVHWIGKTDYPQSGDEAVRLLRENLLELDELRTERTDQYRLDLWRRS